MLNGYGKVDYNLMIGGRLPNVKDSVADLKSVLRLSAREGFGRILKGVLSTLFLIIFVEKLRTLNSYIDYLFLGLLEYLLTLRKRG